MDQFMVSFGAGVPPSDVHATASKAAADGWMTKKVGRKSTDIVLLKEAVDADSGKEAIRSLGLEPAMDFSAYQIPEQYKQQLVSTTGSISALNALASNLGTEIPKDQTTAAPPASTAGATTPPSSATPVPADGTAKQKKKDSKTKPAPAPAPAPTSATDPLIGIQGKIWDGAGDKATFAKTYLDEAINTTTKQVQLAQWAASPELVLLNMIEDAKERAALTEELFRKKAHLPKTEESVEKLRLQELVERQRVIKAQADAADELVEQMKRWRSLSRLAPKLLVACLLASIVFIGYAIDLTAHKHIDGPTLALIIFVLAVFAVSPAVLLLLERPLAGIDNFTPTGSATTSSGSGLTTGTTAAATTT